MLFPPRAPPAIIGGRRIPPVVFPELPWRSRRPEAVRTPRRLRPQRIVQDERARRDAVTILGEDPQLLEHPELAETIERYLDPDAEAFLDRG